MYFKKLLLICISLVAVNASADFTECNAYCMNLSQYGQYTVIRSSTYILTDSANNLARGCREKGGNFLAHDFKYTKYQVPPLPRDPLVPVPPSRFELLDSTLLAEYTIATVDNSCVVKKDGQRPLLDDGLNQN
jgi:hypothetical protein